MQGHSARGKSVSLSFFSEPEIALKTINSLFLILINVLCVVCGGGARVRECCGRWRSEANLGCLSFPSTVFGEVSHCPPLHSPGK